MCIFMGTSTGQTIWNIKRVVERMYELSGTIKDFSVDFVTGKPRITMELNEKQSATACFDELSVAPKLSIKIDKFREKRSLDANAYFFVLADKLAQKLNLTKEEIYRGYIKEIGGVSETVCVKNEAVEKLCQWWKHNGLGWQTDTFPSKIAGCTNVILYYGSSTYDVSQMNRLISMAVEDCKLQGIDVRTPDEIENMLNLWGEK